MSRGRTAISVAALLLIAAATATPHTSSATAGSAAPCVAAPPGAAYEARVRSVLAAGSDVWGNALLAARGGASYSRASSLLQPLWWARGPHGSKLTATGAYYLPFADPSGPGGAGSVALHVADGSQIVAQTIGGATLGVFVGAAGRERYGSCLGRLGGPSLAGGYLPILETRYVDADGVRYRQESFAANAPGTGSLVSFIRLDVDARRASRGAIVRFSSSRRGLVGPSDVHVARGSMRTLYVAWPDTSASSQGLVVDAASYAGARAGVVAYWNQQLAAGASISVPDARVRDALRALTIQDLELTWRYSIGNPYEEFSFPESVDVAQVLAELGYTQVAESILRTSFTRSATPYPNWKKGERLTAVAEVYRLSGDASFVAQATPVLRGYVGVLGRQIHAGRGLLSRERYSSDIPNSVYGLHSQAVVWEGLESMAGVWAATGQPALAAACRRLAARLHTAVLRAVASSKRRLPDGSLFVPVSLLGGEQPYARLTDARLGSYWNLVMPYALASGIFPPKGEIARGILSYMERHGSRLLGLVRAGAYALYGRTAPFPVSGTDQVYGINVDRFLADNDDADQLDLSLAGELAAAMTRGTFVSGEAASVAPLAGTGRRAMYLPPNAASNAALLENVRSLLVHETRSATDAPLGLQLAFATPRTWLEPGRRVAVSNLPTSFGPLAYSLAADAGAVHASVQEPSRAQPRSVELRLRLPPGRTIADVTVDGGAWHDFDRASGTIHLPVTGDAIDLVARVVSH